jgi:hypothetical protein
MKKMIVLSAALLSCSAWAQTPAAQADVTVNGRNPNQVVCETIPETGSRLSHRRVCLTRAQWDERRRTTRQEVERNQTQHPGRQY